MVKYYRRNKINNFTKKKIYTRLDENEMNDVIPTITVHNIYFSILVIFIQYILPFYNIHIVVNNCLIQCKLNQIKLYIHLNKIHILINNNSNQDSLLNLFKIKYDHRCDMDKVYIHNYIYQSLYLQHNC